MIKSTERSGERQVFVCCYYRYNRERKEMDGWIAIKRLHIFFGHRYLDADEQQLHLRAFFLLFDDNNNKERRKVDYNRCYRARPLSRRRLNTERQPSFHSCRFDGANFFVLCVNSYHHFIIIIPPSKFVLPAKKYLSLIFLPPHSCHFSFG